MKNKCAVILAGGFGTRMGQLTKNSPKTLVKVMGKPIIWYILNELLRNKFNKIIITLGYRGNKIRKYVEKEFKKEIHKINLIETGQNSSIAQRIYKVKNFISSENFLLANGDAIFQINYQNKKKYFDNLNLDALLFSYQMIIKLGIIEINSNKKILSFNKEQFFDVLVQNQKKNKSYLMPYTGMAILKTKLLSKFNFKKENDFEIFFYNKLIKRKKVAFYKIKKFWFSFDNPKDILSASNNNFVKKKIHDLKKAYLK